MARRSLTKVLRAIYSLTIIEAAAAFQPGDPGSGGGHGWPVSKKLASTRGDGQIRGSRTGNWTSVKCDDPAVWDWDGMPPKQRWDGVNASDAFKDVVRQWKTYDSSHGFTSFSASVFYTLQGRAEHNICEHLDTGCSETKVCTDFVGQGTGPAAYFLYNSFVMLHQSFQAFHDALHAEAATVVSFAIDAFIDKFAPLSPEDDNKGLYFILDLVTLGATAGMSSMFHSWFKDISYVDGKPETLANAKDTVYQIIAGSTSIAHDLYSNPTVSGWTLEKQHDFKAWVGQIIKGIAAMNTVALAGLFNGTDQSISLLADIISDGKMMIGSDGNGKVSVPTIMRGDEMGHNLVTVIFGYSIPVLWRLSGRKPFILDSGSSCDTKLVLGIYVTQDAQDRTRACYNGKLYFLVMPDGLPERCLNGCSKAGCQPVCRPNQFSAPPGIEYLGKNGTFHDITVEKIIQGSVKTYIQNGNRNGGDKPDVSNKATVGDLMDMDITTPGFFRIPVCSGKMAHKAWGNTLESDDLYPCLAVK